MMLFAAALTSARAAVDHPSAPQVAMIFDDGPVERQTESFIQLLAQEKVRASFAYVGRNAAAHQGSQSSLLAGATS